MNKKAKKVLYIGFGLIATVLLELFYIAITKTPSQEDIIKKNEFIKLSKLSDIAISTEANYIRQRSVTTFFSIHRDDPTLREYFPSTFAINIHIKEDR